MCDLSVHSLAYSIRRYARYRKRHEGDLRVSHFRFRSFFPRNAPVTVVMTSDIEKKKSISSAATGDIVACSLMNATRRRRLSKFHSTPSEEMKASDELALGERFRFADSTR